MPRYDSSGMFMEVLVYHITSFLNDETNLPMNPSRSEFVYVKV